MGIFHGYVGVYQSLQPLETVKTVSLEEQFSGPFAVSLGMLTPLRGKAQDLSCNQVATPKTSKNEGLTTRNTSLYTLYIVCFIDRCASCL